MAVREVWKRIPGYKGYEASDRGRVRSVDRYLPDGRFRRGQLLKQSLGDGGYLQVGIGHSDTRRVHCLVMLAFRGRPPAGKEVRHWDGKRSNNRLANLTYGTRTQNVWDRVRHGTSNRGERCGSAVLSRQDVRFIRRSSMRVKDLAERFGVSVPTICDARSGRNWGWLP